MLENSTDSVETDSTDFVETDEEEAVVTESAIPEDTQETSSGQPKPPPDAKIYETSYVVDKQFQAEHPNQPFEELSSEYSEQIHRRLMRKEALTLKAVAEGIHRSYYLEWSMGSRELSQVAVRRSLVKKGVEIPRKDPPETVMRVDPTQVSKKRRSS